MKTFYSLLLFGSFVLLCPVAHGQASIDYADIQTAVAAPKNINQDLDFVTAIISSTLNINKIPTAGGEKAKIVVKDPSGSIITGVGGLGATQASYNIQPFITGAGPVSFKLSIDGGTKFIDVIISDKKAPPPPVNALSQKEYEDAIKADYGLKLQSGTIKYDRKRNIQHSGNVIHIFIDELGNLYFSGFPTTAREDNLYKIHLYYTEEAGKTFKMESEGVYQPVMEVYGTETTSKANSGAPGKPVILEKEFATVGPFTGTVQLKVIKTKSGIETVIINKTVSIAKLHKITLTAGLYASFLRNPENISMYVKPDGDTTLTADYPNSRSFVTVMLSFYPWPRNILYPSDDPKERFSISVGTSINKNLGENFFGMLNYDVAQGLAVSVGAHYGARNHIIGYPNFKYGEEKFSGKSLANQIKKEYNINWAVGLSIDFRLLTYIFKAPAAPGAAN